MLLIILILYYEELIGFLIKVLHNNVVIVEVDGKQIVGRKVNNWVEL